MNRNNIYVIVGPTASGKTKLSIELAKKIDACIINADASQFRRGLDIGTAKIKKEEMGQIDHYLIDIIDADEDFSIYDFQLLGRKILNREIEKRDIIIVGGSGLYINALLFDYDLSSEKRDKSEEKYKDLSNQELYEMLCSLNIELAQKTHFNNRNRVIRYLELAQSDSLPKKDPVLLYDNVHIYFIDRDRTELYDSINKRTIEMLESGWIEEVKGLKEKGINLNKIKEIGYKEINDYLNGLIDKDKLIEIISQKTRNYAKRQVTWFKHQIDCKFIQSINDIDVINDSIVVSLKTNLLINSQNENYYLISTLLKIYKKFLKEKKEY